MTTPRPRNTTLTAFLTTALAAGAAQAQDAAAPAPAPEAAPAAAPGPEPAPAVDMSVTATTPEPAAEPAPAADAGKQEKWILRHRPTRNSWEIGIYGGVFLPSKNHEFYAPDLGRPNLGHQTIKPAFDVGLRIGYYPLSFLGLELEGGVMPGKAADGSKATMYTFRPVAVFQLPYRIAPFIRADFGLIGINGARLGKDIDPTLGVGGGVKFYVSKRVLLRVDVVDNIATAVNIGNDRSNNLEVTLGIGLRFGGKKKEEAKPLIDTDADGMFDPGQPGVAPEDEDACPTQPGPRENKGCPLIDSDGDGLFDPGQAGVPPENVDACPNEPGPRENQGCPLIDSDGDTLYDPGQPVPASEVDDCPKEPGPRELQGCPDKDGDKIIDKLDKCPEQPETFNQYEDQDGCPDKLPEAVKKISGVIEGIYFDVDKDTIKPRSKTVLDRAVKVLKEFPTTRWNIQGHTDSDGTREHNVDLSHRRAESVRKYLVDNGIDGARIVPQGFGPDAPIDTNATPKGKAKNRRIEFRLID